jgi:hypothetical protein
MRAPYAQRMMSVTVAVAHDMTAVAAIAVGGEAGRRCRQRRTGHQADKQRLEGNLTHHTLLNVVERTAHANAVRS